MEAIATDLTKVEAFLGRTLSDLSASYGGVMVSLGHRLGLYKAMAGAGPISASELAQRSGCALPYVAAWLNSQAAGGYVEYQAVSDTYELPPEHALVLADEESPFFMPPAWQVPASMWFDEEKTIESFRTGKGVSWGDHDARLHRGVAAFYRNGYRASLVSQWLPALDGVVDRLKKGIRVADIGCGFGHSSVLMAEAFPWSRFYGFDVHSESIEEARRNAADAGVQSGVEFEVATASNYPGTYDLICFFDALHDLGDPIGALKYAAGALAPGGTVMVVEPFANDRVEDNLSVISRMYYAASATICTPHSISEGGTHVLGTQAGEARLAEVFRKAGFRHFRRATATPFNLVLEARL